MAEDKRTIDAGVADSILIIKTTVDLLLLGLNGNQSGYERLCDDSRTLHDDEPAFLKIIDFEKEGLPTKMGAMRLGDNSFFLFGGRKTFARSRFGKILKSVYKLVHGNDDWCLELTSEVKKPTTPKISPRVEEVNGNIFVLQDILWFTREQIPHRLLEAYDTTFKTWKRRIPTQPSWGKEEQAIINSGSIAAAFSVGCRIYIVMKNLGRKQWFFCFDTDKFKWDDKSASNLRKSFQNSHVTLPVSAVCVSRIDNLEVNHNVILCKHYSSMIACLIDDSGNLLCYQDLSLELYKDHASITYCAGESLINHKSGGGRMCLVTKFPDVKEWVILIRDFELKLKKGFKEQVQELSYCGTSRVNREMEFLTVDVYNNRSFSLEDRNGACFGLRDAFFL